MNDEIKEILTYLKQEADDNNWFEIDYKEAKVLKDYITNLQQEVEQYENPDDLTLFYMWLDEKAKDKMKELEQENERLKEDLKGQENLTLSYCKSEQDYKSRCEKAIEYIKENKHLSMFADCREPEEDWNYDLECSANDLLNILQNGGDS